MSKFINCYTNDDCLYLNFCILNKCIHKRFFPPTIKEIIGAFLIVLASAISNMGGIGGGGIMSPILKFYLNFNKKDGMTISKLTNLSGSITSLIMRRNQKLPGSNKIPIDYNLVILLVPLVLFGTSVGIILNQIIPQFLSLLIVSMIIAINTYKTVSLYNDLRMKFYNKSANDSTTTNEVLSYGNKESDTESDTNDDNNKVESQQTIQNVILVNLKKLEYEKIKDGIRFPFYKMIYALIAETFLLLISMLKGSRHIESIFKIKTCSLLFWLIELAYFPITIMIIMVICRKIKSEYLYKKHINYKFSSHDIHWNNKNIVKFCFIGLLTGCLSGTLGLGSGLILVPLLLSFNVTPLVSTSTSLMVNVFECISVSFQSLFLGNFNIDYIIIFPILSSFGGFIGTNMSRAYIAKSNRSYFLVGVVAVVLIISFVIYFYNFLNLLLDWNEDLLRFNSVCSDN